MSVGLYLPFRLRGRQVSLSLLALAYEGAPSSFCCFCWGTFRDLDSNVLSKLSEGSFTGLTTVYVV